MVFDKMHTYLRLLKLPAEIQLGLQEKKIEAGHAKALASLNDAKKQIAIYEAIIKNQFSVRETEKQIRNLTNENSQKPAKVISEQQKKYENIIKKIWGNRVQLYCGEKGYGKLSITFSDEQELNSLLDILKKSTL